MADVSGKFFSAKKVRTGVSPSSPGVIVGETLPPVNPPGGGLNSVGLTMPAAFAVANSPLTSNGTIEVTGAGTSSQFVKGDGSLDSTAYGTGSVTSVGLTMPSAFNVGSSPITTNGTLAVTGAGTTAQYVRGDGSLATFPGLTGFVPYTGATADVDLGTHDLTAERGTFQNNGSSDTLTVNHTSGSGYGIEVTKGGNNEALYVNKTSGSGNAMAVVGGRTSLVDLSLSSVSNATGNFLTISGGVVHQRTPSETRSDVGAQAQLNGTGFVKASGTTITYDNSTYQVTSEKAQPNGYASLDSNGKVPLVQINDALIGNVNFQGLWNAATNTPTLANPPASGTKGYYYIVSTAGTFAGIDFEVGDWIISNGTAWGKVDNTDAVSSVFGRTGNVTATNGDYNTSQVTENTNLYYTEARVNANTNVAANTAARHNAVTLGTANGLSLNVQQLSLQLATSGQNGALSSTDWTTFNSKQNALTNPVTGTGSAGQVAYWLSGSAITGESNLFWDATNDRLGIGTNTPLSKLHVEASEGNIRIIDSDDGGTMFIGNASGYSYIRPFSRDFRFLNAAGTSLLAITSGGNVLIGTTDNPGFNLNVNGTGRFAGTLLIKSGNGNQLILDNSSERFTQINFQNNATQKAAIWWDNTNTELVLLASDTGTGHLKIASTGAATFTSTVTATQFIRSGGTSSQFLKADGSIDSNSYYLSSNPSAFIALTALTGTAPIQYNNTTGAISITQSSGSTNGFLSSTDWNTFNNKTSNVGTVTSVAALTLGTSGTDLSSSVANGTTTPVITLNVPTASAANRGALSAADWTTFNNKENAITAGTTAQYYRGDKTFQTLNTAAVPELTNLYYTEARVNANTNVAANTAARHNAVTLGTANGLSLSTQELSLGLSSSSANGALSSTDWTTFNNKQNALTNPVTGTGTAGQVSYFNGTSSITGESNLFWDATNDRLGIGNASPAAKLDVNGVSLLENIQIGTTSAFLTNSVNAMIGWASSFSGYTNGTLILQSRSSASTPIVFATGSTSASEKMRLDPSGHLGLGVTPSAWFTNANVKALEIGYKGNAIYGVGGSDMRIISNAFFDGAYKYADAGPASVYQQNDGIHRWFTAPSGTAAGNAITFTQAMTLGTNSGLSIGTLSAAPSQGLLVQGEGRFNSNGFFGGATAFAGLAGGISVNGSTNSGINFRIADVLRGYVYVAGNLGMYVESTAGNVVLAPTGVPALTATTSGNVGIGCNPITKFQVQSSTNRRFFVGDTGSQVQIGGLNDAGSDYVPTAIDGSILLLNAFSGGNVLIGTQNSDIGGSVSGVGVLPAGKVLASNTQTGIFSAPFYGDRRGTNNSGPVFTLAMGGFWKADIGIIGTNSSSNDSIITFNTISDNANRSERMRIWGSSGNVNIGPTPASDAGFKLDVNGTGRFSSDVGIGTAPSEILHLKDGTRQYVGLRLEGSGAYAGSDWTLYASSTSPNSADDFLGFYNNSSTDGATAEYKFRLFKTGAATFSSSVQTGGDILVRGSNNPYASTNRGNITLNGTSSNILAFTNNTTAKGYILHDNSDMEIRNVSNLGTIQFYVASGEAFRVLSGRSILTYSDLLVGGTVIADELKTLTPIGNSAPSPYWRLGYAATGTVNPNRLIRIEIEGVGYDLVARQII
jgi:hypothetical protein